MAGITKTHIQLGDSATATNNFMLTSQTADGTMKLARGNNGATTQDILTVNADGGIKGIQPAFSAYQSTVQSLAQNANTKLQFQTKEFDTATAFDATTNFRFTPAVAGYYQVSGSFAVATTQSQMYIYIYKNGVQFKSGGGNNGGEANISALIFLNGSTDYIELWCYQGAAAQNTVANAFLTYFQAILLRAA